MLTAVVPVLNYLYTSVQCTMYNGVFPIVKVVSK